MNFWISSHSSFIDNESDKSNLCQLLHIRISKKMRKHEIIDANFLY